MSYLLDTNVVSELRKIRVGRCHPAVSRWANGVDPYNMYLSVVSVFELERGAILIGRRDPVGGARLRAWVDQLAETFRDRLLAVDAAVARRSATFNVPDPTPLRDGLIAATASVHAMTVVTRNVSDFERSGVAILNPWTL